MVLKPGTIIPFQYKKIKKLVQISNKNTTDKLNKCDVEIALHNAFNIPYVCSSYDFYNKKIGFQIPAELLVPYLEQRNDYTNFVIEIVDKGGLPAENGQHEKCKPNDDLVIPNEWKRLLENSDNYSPVSKRFKQNSVDAHLDDILKTSEGQSLLYNFKNSKQLTDQDRSYLVKLITEYEMEEILMFDNPLAIDYKRYVELAAAIIRRFPGEVQSYYYTLPSKVLKRIPGGKLYDQFTTMKCEFLEMETRDNVENDFPEMWDLLNIISNWESYCKAWKESFVLRCSYVRNIDEPMAYFKRFIAEVGEHAIQLVEHDFERMHPGSANKLLNNWDLMSEQIFTEAIVRCQKDVPVIMDLYGNVPQLAGFMMLGYLLMNYENDEKAFAKDDPGNLIAHFDTIDGKVVDVFKKYCLNNNRRDAMVFITGKCTEDFSYHVLVGDSLYTMDTALKAVDFCFKCYQVLGFLYANRQCQVWQVIQKVIYGIDRYDEDRIAVQFCFQTTTYIEKCACPERGGSTPEVLAQASLSLDGLA